MLYYLTNTFQGWLGDSVYWVIQIFTQFHFRAFAALIFSFLFVLVFGPRTIKRLQELKVSDHPETFNTELNTLNQARFVVVEENRFGEDDLSGGEPPDLSTRRGLSLLKVHFYAHLQELLVEASGHARPR